MENLDRRVRKTRNTLRQCLAKLMKTKKIQDISVKELADMADINRGTFYLHYKDVYDLLSHIEADMFDQWTGILDKYTGSIEELEEHPGTLIREIFKFVTDNFDMAMILMGANGDIHFTNQLKELFREKLLNVWANHMRQQQLTEFEYYYNYMTAGFIGMIDYWFKSNMKETPDELTELSERFIRNGLSSLTSKPATF